MPPGGKPPGGFVKRYGRGVSNPLEDYFDSHTDGRGIWKWRHYFDIYHRHLQKFVGTDVHVVEIGVYSGGSLDMWKQYFGPASHIYGVDIDPACRAYDDAQTRIFIGDQEDPAFWAEFIAQVPRVDVVIDDGGHKTRQQVATIEAMLPHIRPGGVYICEDIHGPANPFHAYIGDLSRKLHSMEKGDSSAERTPTDFQREADSVHIYPFVAVVEKRAEPLAVFSAPKRGSEWIPLRRPGSQTTTG
jgi:23S rRNA U2552 (ribose-2'-O)-methylase RlmE/FtsJ